MDRAFISEWVKLRRSGMAVAIAAIVGFAVLTIVLTFTKAESASGGSREMFGAPLGVVQLSAADGFARAFARGGTFIGVVALGIVAMNIAAEFSEGTLRNLLVRQPRRIALFGASFLPLPVSWPSPSPLRTFSLCWSRLLPRRGMESPPKPGFPP